MQRSVNIRDMHSGNTSFPGGKVDIGETDLEAGVREVREEIGVDLKQPQFVYLGKLPRNFFIYRAFNKLWLLSNLVYFAVDPHFELNPSKDEVSRVCWSPINDIFRYKGSRLYSKKKRYGGLYYLTVFYEDKNLEKVINDFEGKVSEVEAFLPHYKLENDWIVFGTTLEVLSGIVDLM